MKRLWDLQYPSYKPVIHDDEIGCSRSDECETMKELFNLLHEAENTDDENIDPSLS